MRDAAVERVSLVFSLFDANGTGRLDQEDFELMAGRVVAVADGSPEEDKQAVVAAFRGYWDVLLATLDADGDGEVTWAEFRACVLSPERFDATVAVFADALSRLGDPDGDGLVERPRFLALMRAIGFAEPNVHALFDALGPSAADLVEVDAWRQAIVEFYAPDKDGIAGDRLVGEAVR
ncbi:EF-hand domain-containing protein [Saccharothrix obliqua]|uniref:EF-hand domain-containing protein n=1 Tax=Saccharothrix obliqua TaxID=2861747 RepID=UPI001C5D9FBC|nr:EF-hand domain-containing protein [Saccharothrix obliqua]MBW4717173.1 EF-hand domain-containing protein [Saccharothrix obliqua]